MPARGSIIWLMDTSPADAGLQAALRSLPAVDHVLNEAAVADLLADYPRNEVVYVVRSVLAECRAALLAGRQVRFDPPALALEIRQRLYQRSQPNLRRVINATGVVLHTGLGRAPLADEAVNAVAEVAAGYCNLELDLATGRRGDRHEHVRELLRELTGAEDALVVNNNAAATYLALSALGTGRGVIIARGQLVEIGGSYRLPDIMAAAGCRMVEVGTTNRTRIADYERAIDADTGVLLRVHTSNYRIRGFAESASLAELVKLARQHNLLVVDDLGSGLVTEDLPWPALPPAGAAESTRQRAARPDSSGADAPPLPTGPAAWDEPSVRRSVADGADLTLFSGDKLLGGPQAGVLVGRAELIAALLRSPLARVVRPGKLTLAALEATLRLYRDPAAVLRRVPVWRLLARSPESLGAAASQLARHIAEAAPTVQVAHEPGLSEVGGGALPDTAWPTSVVTVRCTAVPAAELATALRRRDLPIICRVRDEALVFDVRTLDGDDAEVIPPALAEALHELASAR